MELQMEPIKSLFKSLFNQNLQKSHRKWDLGVSLE